LKIQFRGSVSKLIRHERFREKSELKVTDEKTSGTEIIDSLVISDHCKNLRLIDLSSTNITDNDINLFVTNGQFAITTIILNNCFGVTEKGIN